MIYFKKWQITGVLLACVLSVLLALPNLFPKATIESLPGWVPSRQLSLGLDLQGGSHLLFQLDTDSVVREHMAALVDSVRADLRKANIGYTDLAQDGDHIVLKLREGADRTQARDILQAVDTDLTVTLADSGDVTLAMSPIALARRKDAAVQQSIEIIRRRVDETGTKEPTIQAQGSDRILVQLPGLGDPQRVKALIGTTAKLSFRLVDPDATPDRVPPGDEALPGDRIGANGQPIKYVVRKRVMVSGETLVDAQPSFQDGQPVVSFRFDSNGARRFADATTENTGKLFAIVLDNKIISAPVIREPITGGRGIISGSFTAQSASDLALLLRAGALPAPLTVIEERTVGPDLGADSIKAGAIASAVAIALVIVFMLVFYGLFGFFADIALFFNLAMLLASLTLLQATLTLPGIAGIALTMGMAVDANVLIYERIREERRNGLSVIAAIDTGFRRAFGTILDSHVTTLIAGALLFWLGSGPVKGFAVTLSLGVLTSLFTALLVTRLIVSWWLKRYRPKALPV